MNKITIIGRLVADPELTLTPNGVNCCKFRVAVNRRFRSDEADFFPVTVWREAGVSCNKYLRKGSQVAVIGALQTRLYEQDEIKKLAIEIMADEVEFLTPKRDAYSDYSAPQSNGAENANKLEEVEDYGEMPF